MESKALASQILDSILIKIHRDMLAQKSGSDISVRDIEKISEATGSNAKSIESKIREYVHRREKQKNRLRSLSSAEYEGSYNRLEIEKAEFEIMTLERKLFEELKLTCPQRLSNKRMVLKN